MSIPILIGSGQSFGLPCSRNLLSKGVILFQVKMFSRSAGLQMVEFGIVADTFKATVAAARQRVLAEELNPEVTLRRFAKLFNLTEGAFKQGELISV